MTRDQIVDVISVITARVYGDTGNITLGSSPGTSPVTLTIGYVSKNNIVQNDGVIITDAPATIINDVMDWVHERKQQNPHCHIRASAGFGGLLIR